MLFSRASHDVVLESRPLIFLTFDSLIIINKRRLQIQMLVIHNVTQKDILTFIGHYHVIQ